MGDETIVHKEGEPVGQLMSTWRLLRDHHPDREWQSRFTVFGQSAAMCDSVIAIWLSDHIQTQCPDVPSMILTDCLGASWAPETVQTYWINNQPAFPLAPGTTSYLAVPDTHIHAPMKAYFRQAKSDLQEEVDREFVIEGANQPYQWGLWETAQVVSRGLDKLEELQRSTQIILQGAIQNQLLAFRPDAVGDLVCIDDWPAEEWTKRFPRRPVFRGIPQYLADHRVEEAKNWPEGVPPVPDWSVLDKLGNYLDQRHHPDEDPDDPESQAVVLDGRFADLTLTPAQMEMLVPIEQRISALPRGASHLTKKAAAAKKHKTKRRSKWAKMFGQDRFRKQVHLWKAKLVQAGSKASFKLQTFGTATRKHKLWHGARAKAKAIAKVEHPALAPVPLAPVPWESSPFLRQDVRIVKPDTHPQMIGLRGEVQAHHRKPDETGENQGTLTVFVTRAKGGGTFQTVHIPVREVCLVSQLPAHAPLGPARLN